VTVDANASIEKGKAARNVAGRDDLAAYEPPADRRDPVEILIEQGADRQQDLLPIRYGRMAASPFAFLRGAAAVMAADLAPSLVTGLRVQAIGDAHISNFGVFATPERRLVFDVNDFDETLPAPWEWDVKRFVASVAVAARENGSGRKASAAAAERAAAAYRAALRDLAARPTLETWYAHLDVADLVQLEASRKRRGRDEKALAKIRLRTSAQVAGKLTERVDGKLRFKSLPPLVSPLRDLVGDDEADQARDLILRAYAGYRTSLAPERRQLLGRFHLVDVAHKVVGVGSVGTRCLVGLFIGHNDDDVLVLQFKEATRSVLEPYAGRSQYRQSGARVVNGQRLVQVASDVFLGYNALDEGRHYYWRQLRDMKASAEIATLGQKQFDAYVRACAWCLAHAHARSGDPIAIAAYLGAGTSFDAAMGAFAAAYAEQTKADWKALNVAISAGDVLARTDI
jgi:uncharacterized protein (DUF2252 family)